MQFGWMRKYSVSLHYYNISYCLSTVISSVLIVTLHVAVFVMSVYYLLQLIDEISLN